MAITHESISTPGSEIDSQIADLRQKISALSSRSSQTQPAALPTGAQSWVWDCLGRWGLTTSTAVVRTRVPGTIVGWQVATPASAVPASGTGAIELRVDGTVVDTITWDFSKGAFARSEVSVPYDAGQEIAPWVTSVSALPDGVEVRDVSIEVWRSE